MVFIYDKLSLQCFTLNSTSKVFIHQFLNFGNSNFSKKHAFDCMFFTRRDNSTSSINFHSFLPQENPKK